MPRYKMLIGGGDSDDLHVYDSLVAAARERGFNVMPMGVLSEHTLDQEQADINDSWLRFSAGCPAFMKVVETTLVNSVLSKEHIARNAQLAAEKSKVLAKHGLKAAVSFLEPMWLPESFYAKHPDTRGARCDNPCLSLGDYYAPCLDNTEVLAHYREATRKLLELAPEIAVITIGTNDSGAGICWCTGLYPGPNGPAQCKDVSMGARLRRWFEAILAGAADARRPLDVFFVPVHFSRVETLDTLEKLPRHAGLCGRHEGNLPDVISLCRKRGRDFLHGVNPTLVDWLMSPAVETPFPYFNLDAMGEVARSGANVLSVGGICAPQYGIDTVPTMAIMSGLKKPPASSDDVDRRVLKIARLHVGPRLAPALVTAWRNVDRALRLWLTLSHADTNHMLYPHYGLIGDRWMLRPIVPEPRLVPDKDKEYYSRHRHHGRNPEEADSFFIAESTKNYRIDELKWPVAIYNEMVRFTDAAVAALDAARPKVGSEDELTGKRFMLQYRRVAAMRAIWRTQKNVLRAGSIIEFFTGEKKDEYWHVVRKDESFLLPATYRRLFLEAIEDEIANAREMIRLITESDVKLFSTGDVETAFVLPHNLPELLEKKIAVMEAHKGDIDALFPNCPPETFTDPTYEWADKRFHGQRKN